MGFEYAHNAIDLPERLFSDVDFDTNEARYYEALNNIAIAVAEYRYNHGLSQASLAEAIGVSQAMVSKYESGDYNISLKAVFELLEKLRLKVSLTIEPEDDESISSVDIENYASSIGAQVGSIVPEHEPEIINAA